MLISMTGYGRSEFILGEYICTIELRSLNGKNFEYSSRLSAAIKSYEIDLRNSIQQLLIRGSVELVVFLKQHGNSKPVVINKELAKYYFDSISQIADEMGLEKTGILNALIRMPDIVSNVTDTISEENWLLLQEKMKETCELLLIQRKNEGNMLTEKISANISQIEKYSHEIIPHEQNRIQKVRQRLESAMNEFEQNNTLDKNRLEQEFIYYIEKLDIKEELNRLQHHCNYFSELVNEDILTKGKKLGFLLQEIGREINTLGSKANDFALQKIVVQMKDELEQAKEQLLNVL
ncbi:MAG: DUF1732 domain-containing protein [Chitinophagaceae bacterium]